MNLIKTNGLSFEYEKYDENSNTTTLLALHNINVSVEKGSFISILGRNGSGKSTLAKLINALLVPTKGTVWVKGYDTKNEDFLWNIRQNVGMVFQNPDNQIIATIVEEDVAFGPENLGIEPDEIRLRVDESLVNVGMREHRNHSINLLSGGQKQLVAIAGVLAMKPDCIVLDEPTAMLDPIGRRDVLDTIMRLNKEEGITVILITHFMEEAVHCDKIFVMDNGNVVMNGSPSEIFVHVDKLKAIGLDVPQVTETAYNLIKRGFDISPCVLTIEELVGEICRYKLKT